MALDWVSRPLLLLRGGTTVTSAGMGRADILIRDGVIVEIGEDLAAPEGAVVEDVGGLTVTPGFVDVHVHLRDPGAEDSETLATGLDSAAAGGIHHVFCMANTDPVNDTPERTADLIARARELSPLTLHPVAAVTRGLVGDDLTDFGDLVEAGAGAFSNDGLPVDTAATLARALEQAMELHRTILIHAEDRRWAAGGAVDIRAAKRLGARGIHVEAEDLATARDVGVAMEVGAPLHICHVSTVGSIDIVRAARAAGGRITCEATPHHLLLSYDDIPDGTDTDFKMNPPLRSPADVEGLVRGVCDGTVTAIATDHAPHSAARKAKSMDEAAFGAIGLETSFSVSYTALVATGRLALERLIALYVDGPGAIAGVDPPRIERGARAELNLIDLEGSWRVDPAAFRSRSRNCPFKGRELRSRVVGVVAGDRFWRERARRSERS